MLGLKLNHVSKRGPRYHCEGPSYETIMNTSSWKGQTYNTDISASEGMQIFINILEMVL